MDLKMTGRFSGGFSVRCVLFSCALLCFSMLACRLELVQEPKRIIGGVSIEISGGTGEWLSNDSLLKAHVEGIATGGLTYQWRWTLDDRPSSPDNVIKIGPSDELNLSDVQVPAGARMMVVVFSDEYQGAVASAKTWPKLGDKDPPKDLEIKISGGLDVGSLLESEISCPGDPDFEDGAIYQWVRSKGGDADGEYAMINGAMEDRYMTTETDRDRFIKLLVFNPAYNHPGESRYIGPVGGKFQITVPDTSIVGVGQKILVEATTMPPGQSVVWSIDGGPNDHITITDANANPVEVDAGNTDSSDKDKTWTITAALASNPSVTATGTVKVDDIEVVVRPDGAEVPVGGALQFSAEAHGTSDQNFTWSLSYMNPDPGTTTGIDANGLLTVDPLQKPRPFTVTATWVADSSVKGSAQGVFVLGEGVTGVSVSPVGSSIALDGKLNFTATVHPPEKYGPLVEWKLYNNTQNRDITGVISNDMIDKNKGTLDLDLASAGSMVDSNDELTLTATSDVDNTYSGSATIKVVGKPTSITVTPLDTLLGPKGSTYVYAEVTPGTPLSIIWTLDDPDKGTITPVPSDTEGSHMGETKVQLTLTGAVSGEKVTIRAQVDTTDVYAEAVIDVQDSNEDGIDIGWGDFDNDPLTTLGPFDVSMTGANGMQKEVLITLSSFPYAKIRWRHNGEIIKDGGSTFLFDSSVYGTDKGYHYMTCEVKLKGDDTDWWSAEAVIDVKY